MQSEIGKRTDIELEKLSIGIPSVSGSGALKMCDITFWKRVVYFFHLQDYLPANKPTLFHHMRFGK
jgi:hypothetical protein